MLGKAGDRIRSIPVMVEIHESGTKTGGQTIVEKMAHMMGTIAETAGKGAVGVCDVWVFSKTMLDAAGLFLDKNGKRLLHIVTHAKKNAVGFTPPVHNNTARRRGRPRIYGKKLSPTTCFRTRKKDFTETVMSSTTRNNRSDFFALIYCGSR
jgi:hypothetical protein